LQKHFLPLFFQQLMADQKEWGCQATAKEEDEVSSQFGFVVDIEWQAL